MKTLLLGALLWVAAFTAHGAPQVVLDTSMGKITLELDETNAPLSTANFLAYVRDGFYNGTVFHRVIDGFMIQGGGFEPGMRRKNTRAPIKNEAANGLKNTAGSIAMARTMDPHSATAQFYINLVDNAPLDYPSRDGWGYAVFGNVIDGMEVVRQIGKTRTGMGDVPTQDITILKAHEVTPGAH
ncbi:MAG: peptidylprolyl isomerase [Rhodocyclaceae bacterium]|nr:peptidylprolyl isomerase [Rhodocyclaceae bacterium]